MQGPLEVNQGFFDERGVEVGDRDELPKQLESAQKSVGNRAFA